MGAIRGRTSFVTGGGSGIGRALADTLAAEGSRVAVADIRTEKAEEAADAIRVAGGSAIGVTCDVCSRDSLQEAKSVAGAALGPVSLVFANAGATSYERLVDMSDDDVDWMFQVNLMGPVNTLRAFLPDMMERGDGHVVATASISGLLSAREPYHSAYSSAKLGVIGLMMNLRYELAERGVGATVLIPSGVNTGMGANNARYRPDRFGGPREGGVEVPDVVLKELANHSVVFRPPEDVAALVLRAVREDRPIVLTSATDRTAFQETYVEPIMAAFDEVQ